MTTHKDLTVWKKGIELVKNIYLITNSFPKAEQFSIVSQMRRCAISIPSNIAEGCGRNSENELIHFLYIALGSSSELETQIIISVELNFIDNEKAAECLNQLNQIIKMITSLIKSLKLRNPKPRNS
ncbi:MAG: four helix bundle protein [Bacteroidales bacterium]|jgi:four helix bundle protein|nr:four helix bundle protein [Bacteroidales bacterium]